MVQLEKKDRKLYPDHFQKISQKLHILQWDLSTTASFLIFYIITQNINLNFWIVNYNQTTCLFVLYTQSRRLQTKKTWGNDKRTLGNIRPDHLKQTDCSFLHPKKKNRLLILKRVFISLKVYIIPKRNRSLLLWKRKKEKRNCHPNKLWLVSFTQKNNEYVSHVVY